MNRKQKYVLISIASVIIGMLAYPPFQMEIKDGTFNAGYEWILNPPNKAALVNIKLLLTQWLGAILAGGIGFFVLRD